ncbi:adhesin [Alteribacter lacisalsi]|uniref:Adhesin n=1 Tax=Alteribacter lacisalsi TaxID=2045244 RepID=A0A2W0HDE9_9BACI|nr:adhesin [Alteribacter lacisalsi]PYZ98926.1 adhesin [Alteribacter lacisalsi]
MTITDEARAFLEEMLEETQVDAVRFFFAGMGCGSPQLGVRLEDAQDRDEVMEINGIRVAVDPVIQEQTESISLDVEIREGQRSIVMHGLDSCC